MATLVVVSIVPLAFSAMRLVSINREALETAEKQYLTPAQQKQLYELIRERSSCGQHGPMLKGLGLETCK